MKFGKKKEQVEQKEETSEEDLIGYLGIQGSRIPEGYTQVESYPLRPPFSYAWIFQDESEASYLYVVDELAMTKEERDTYKRLRTSWSTS